MRKRKIELGSERLTFMREYEKKKDRAREWEIDF